MTTHQDFIYSSTPVNKYLVKELGLIRGAIASKIIYACNLKDGVCRMGQRRKAEELGIDRSTVSRGEAYLIKERFISVIKEATDTEPAHLKPTKKLLDLIQTVAESNPPVAESNPPVAESNQEEESKEESKEETTTDSSETDESFKAITTAYENEIGLLSPIIAQKIGDCVDDYPTEWIVEAIGIAAGQNVRKWNYVEGVLKKWKTDGKTNSTNGNGKNKKEREKIIDPVTGEWTGGYYG